MLIQYLGDVKVSFNMQNELILIITLFIEFAGVAAVYRIFGKEGLYMWTVIATIGANIEVLMLVRAFSMEMTLGNILFATTFLVTDVLSEIYGKKESQKCVLVGIATSLIFITISQSWLLYLPSKNDFAAGSINIIFSNTPRIMFASLGVYIIVQFFDVWLYHKWWNFTSAKFGDIDRFLWLRNNGSTMVSQLLNAVLYPLFAFAGIYSVKTLLSIMISGYIIFITTSIADTPFAYLCRRISRKSKAAD